MHLFEDMIDNKSNIHLVLNMCLHKLFSYYIIWAYAIMLAIYFKFVIFDWLFIGIILNKQIYHQNASSAHLQSFQGLLLYNVSNSTRNKLCSTFHSQ